jgi:hypothetical protein
MRRMPMLLFLVAVACGTSQPIGPLEGAYAVVFDSSFVAPVRLPIGSFSGGDVEGAVQELFASRDGSFRWYHEPPAGAQMFDAVIVLHIVSMPGLANETGGYENRDTSGASPESTGSATLGYEIRRATGKKSFGSIVIHRPTSLDGTVQPRMLLETASDLYSVLARELQE